MLFTRQNILNRTIAARCCLADLTIDMAEARAKGDQELYDCKMEKAWLLDYAIDEMCYYISNNVFGQNIGEESAFDGGQFRYLFYVENGAAPDSVTLNSARLGGVDIVEKNVELSSPGSSWRQVFERYAKSINDYTQEYSNGVHYARAAVRMSGDNVLTDVALHFDRNKLGDNPTWDQSFGAGPDIDDESETRDQLTQRISCFTNEQARGFLNIMDEVCGCPCKCSGSQITDDTIPKYI